MKFDDPNLRNLVEEVCVKETRVFNPGMETKIIAFDCGMKANIIRQVLLPLNIWYFITLSESASCKL